MDLNVESLAFDTINIRTANGEVVSFNLQEQLQINNFDLIQEFHQQPSKYVYWTSLLEQVRGYLESAELTEETIRAGLYEPCRGALVQGGIAKPTKDQIDAAILQEPEYVAARQTVNNYNYFVKNLQYIVKAFEQRKDMLVQLGAEKRRQEDYERALRAQ